MSAAAQVDVLDAAGRLLADPSRAVVSRAAIVAMADVLERTWAICLEAELLVAAHAMPITGNDRADAVRDHAIQVQEHRVTEMLAALRGTPTKENDDGSSHS